MILLSLNLQGRFNVGVNLSEISNNETLSNERIRENPYIRGLSTQTFQFSVIQCLKSVRPQATVLKISLQAFADDIAN